MKTLTFLTSNNAIVHQLITLTQGFFSSDYCIEILPIHMLTHPLKSDILVCMYINPPTKRQEEYIQQSIKESGRVINEHGRKLADRRTMLNALGVEIIDTPTFPGHYTIRKLTGHGNTSQLTKISTETDLQSWQNEHGKDCIIQRFIDTAYQRKSTTQRHYVGTYVSGRCFVVGGEVYLDRAVETRDWNSNFNRASEILTFSAGQSSHTLFQSLWNPHSLRELCNLGRNLQLDVGHIDFSYYKDKLHIWEVSPVLAFEYPGGMRPLTPEMLTYDELLLVKKVVTYVSTL